MDKDAFELTAQLRAIEYMVVNLYGLLYKMDGTHPAVMHAMHREMLENLASHTVPGMDAAMSDALSAETEAVVRRMLAAIEATHRPRGS